MKPFLLMLILLPALAIAQVYKHVDEKGNITFTDQPPPNSEKIEIAPTNSAPPPAQLYYPKIDTAPAVPSTKYKVKITSPANDTIIPRGPGNFSVSAIVSPSLQPGNLFQLLMDGVPEGPPQRHSSWALTSVFRGTHFLTATIVTEKGKQLAESEPITVYVFRPSVNF